MLVGLLGLQGAFLDHVRHLKTLGVGYTVVKEVDTLDAIDCLIIPGGESTVMEKFMTLFAMTNRLRERIHSGLAVWGICAGCILLARTVDGRPGILGVLPVDLKRNAYGRQLESSKRSTDIPVIGKSAFPALFTIPATFICSPNRRMKPVASAGLYSSPIVKLAKSVL